MEGLSIDDRDRVADEAVHSSRKGWFAILSVIYLVALILMAFIGRDYLWYRIIFGSWTLTYLILILWMARSRISSILDDMTPTKVLIIIFLLGLVVHIPFLFQDTMMSQDVFRLERRGELLLDGDFPYEDFNVNKPPLYIWMVGLVSLPFGPDQMVFRIVFTIVNALVPVAMVLVHRAIKDGRKEGMKGPLGLTIPGFTWMDAAIAYAICPIPIMETAVAGHFDPLVVLTTIFAFHFLVKDKYLFAGLLLGTGFSLKLYPMFIAPVFFLAAPRWKQRFMLFGGFFIVPFASSVPILLHDPALMLEYLQYQFVDWYSGFSIQSILESAMDAIGGPEWIAGRIMMLLLMGGLIFVILRGMFSKTGRRDVMIPAILLFLLGLAGLVQSIAFISGGSSGSIDMALGILGLIFSMISLTVIPYLFLFGQRDGEVSGMDLKVSNLLKTRIEHSDVAFISSSILVMVILTSSQFHPWYIPWALPFILASGRTYWIMVALAGFHSLSSGYYPPWELGGF